MPDRGGAFRSVCPRPVFIVKIPAGIIRMRKQVRAGRAAWCAHGPPVFTGSQ
jgi:hypothetical protein